MSDNATPTVYAGAPPTVYANNGIATIPVAYESRWYTTPYILSPAVDGTIWNPPPAVHVGPPVHTTPWNAAHAVHAGPPVHATPWNAAHAVHAGPPVHATPWNAAHTVHAGPPVHATPSKAAHTVHAGPPVHATPWKASHAVHATPWNATPGVHTIGVHIAPPVHATPATGATPWNATPGVHTIGVHIPPPVHATPATGATPWNATPVHTAPAVHTAPTVNTSSCNETAAVDVTPSNAVPMRTPFSWNEARAVDASIRNATSKKVSEDNKYEASLRSELIPANEIRVKFSDIGALEDIKELLYELVILPLRRPDIFNHKKLLKPCRGILLFGPPGTGKTMLAKAIANEAGASFINVSMSTIASSWYGETEKTIRALFSLAAKVAPTIIFLDEIDSILAKRNDWDKYMKIVKNEFMIHWDGFRTKPGEQVLVLAATNRPFDLDDAVIRRFERRIMVSLPGVESREKIFRSILSEENIENFDFQELATMTDGYTGSDLKNLCVAASYQPVRELLKKEREKRARENEDSVDRSHEASEGKRDIVLRSLNMEDMRKVKNQVAASFASEGAVMNELMQWNELFGEGGARKKQRLTYFL